MICFVINIFNEPKDAIRELVKRLKIVYPKCKVLLVYDGVPRYKIRGVKELEGEHLKTAEKGGAWMHRYLSFANEQADQPYIIKIDPDTVIVSQANHLPINECVFGRVIPHNFGKNKYDVIHGGAIGFTNNVVQWITENEWLLSAKYINNPKFNRRSEYMLCDIINSQKIPVVHRSDFSCGLTPTDSSTFIHS